MTEWSSWNRNSTVPTGGAASPTSTQNATRTRPGSSNATIPSTTSTGENGIWRYLSQVKAYGQEKAREGLLKYEKDDREPFPDVYRLFAGTIAAEDILERIADADIDERNREKRLFYAELYIGLELAVSDEPAEARKHLALAAENTWPEPAGYGPRYMWHVARLHRDLIDVARQNATPADE